MIWTTPRAAELNSRLELRPNQALAATLAGGKKRPRGRRMRYNKSARYR
jgi:hypothetical protein